MRQRPTTTRVQLRSVLSGLILLAVSFLAIELASASSSTPLGGDFVLTGLDSRQSANLFFSARISALSQQAEKTTDEGLWHFIDESALVASQKQRSITPQSYKTVRVNQDALLALLSKAPVELPDSVVGSQLVMELPMPNATLAKFYIEESPIMEPELAAQSPQIKTYRGRGIDDPTATTRFSWTPLGFHAVVLSANGSVWITPYAKDDQDNYITYYQQDLPRDVTTFECLVTDETARLSTSQNRFDPDFVSGTTLRTYRLALALTGEYTQAYGGGTVIGGRTAATVAVNIFNAVFEKEVAIRLILIANEDSIIFTDPATDPYTHGVLATMVNENQTALDNLIGSANYDIGHVFDGSTGGGGGGWQGWAFFGVCVNGFKAKAGIIFTNQQPGNPATAHGMAHEMGHQFGARHTFNGTTGSCGNVDQRVPSSAYEPGSGSTIMAYGRICGNESLPTQDTYYHTASLQQIINFSTTGSGGGACPGQIATGNTPPAADAGADYTIPKSTPYTLTATGSDADGDALTFCWEELDLPTAPGPPNTDADGHQRPIFRSYPPTTVPSRTFPSLQYILNNASVPPTNFACSVPGGSCLTGEVLPSITRTMNFQVTVRDNRVGGGGVRTDLMLLNVRGDSGPFLVTQPNSAVNWTGGSSQTVTWSVNNTNLPPVSCTSVKISLSTDGGNTFPNVLAASTPNDGSQNLVIPNVLATTARIKVEALGNIFFDISDTNFTITVSGSSSETVGLYNPTTSQFFLRNSNSSAPAELVFSYGPAGAGWIPIVGDWNGDGVDTIGLFNPSTSFFFLRNSNASAPADIVFSYGPAGAGWIPISGDWNGNGTDSIGLYNPATSTFFLRNTNSSGPADIVFGYGPAGAGWLPITGDWNGDGFDSIGLYNPASSVFFLSNSNSSAPAALVFSFGPAGAGWKPLARDWNGDGVDTIGLYSPSTSTFFLRNSNTSAPADLVFSYGPAGAGWLPIVGDWDGL